MACRLGRLAPAHAGNASLAGQRPLKSCNTEGLRLLTQVIPPLQAIAPLKSCNTEDLRLLTQEMPPLQARDTLNKIN